MQSRTLSCLPGLLTIIILSFSLLGCFDDGDSPDGPAGTPLTKSAPFTGKFVDGELTGVTYTRSNGEGGLTADGDFPYAEGETVAFSIGTIDLGTVDVGKLITPVELTGSTAATDQAAVNMMVFLQSIDEDSPNSANGISISADTRDWAEGQTLDFTLSSADFTLAVGPVVAALTEPDNAVVSEADALDNFYRSYVAFGGSDTVDWAFPGYPSFPPGPSAMLEDGTFEPPGTDDASGGDQPCVGGVLAGSVWTCTSGSFVTSGFTFGTPSSHADGGFQALKQFDAGEAANVIDVFPGDVVDFTAWAMNWFFPGFSVGLGNNVVTLQLTFWDAPGGASGAGTQIGAPVEVTGADFAVGVGDVDLPQVPGAGGDADWTALSVFGTAPAGAKSAQVSLKQTDTGGDGGFILWDDVSVDVTPAPPPNLYYLVWEDDFDGVDGSLPDPDNWFIETGYGPNNTGWGNNEWQNYTTDPANVSVVNCDPDNPGTCDGYLKLTADCSEAPANPLDCSVRDKLPSPGSVTSGKVSTLMSDDPFTFTFGKVQARIKPPKGKGSWPAFWMLGENFPQVGWPFTGEVDILELSNLTTASNGKTAINNLIWCNNPAQDSLPFCPPASVPDTTTFPVSLGDDFHIFEVEWNAREFIWRVDGVETHRVDIAVATLEEFQKPFYLILNVAMGGTLGSGGADPAVDTAWPQTMLVDWVRVYQGGPILLDEVEPLQDGNFEPPGTDDASAGKKGCPGNTFLAGSAWTCINFPEVVAFSRGDGPVSHDAGGNQSMQLSSFDGIAENTIEVAGGDYVDLSAWLMNWDQNRLDNFAVVIVSFWDQPGGRRAAEAGGGGQQIGDEVTTLVYADSILAVPDFDLPEGAIILEEQDGNEVGDWTEFKKTYLAPAAAKSVNLFLLHQLFQGAPNAGALYVDDVSMIRR